jgi:hypothetical protein
MAGRLIAKLVFVFALGAFGAAACGPVEDGDEVTGIDSQELGREIPIDRLLDDANVEGDQHVTTAQVQTFLANQGSALSQYSAGGRTAAQWIVDEARAELISPVYILARMETESGIIRSGSLSKLSKATGCGCPDGAQCDPAYANFGLQVRCAAQKMRGYLKSLATNGQTVSGWRVGVSKQTSDPCWVKPANRVTAALYTYTPWVGAYGIGCGTSKWGGSSLVAGIYKGFRGSFDLAPAECAAGDGLYCGGNGVNGDVATLYRCTSAAVSVAEKCVTTCERAPGGAADKCASAPPPPPPPAEPACTLGNGLYCGGNGTPGDPTALYRCTGGTSAVVRTCALGCKRMPSGTEDTCATGSACPLGDGEYCGGNGIGGAPSTLYQCTAGRITPKLECARGCRQMPAGQADACN